MIDYKYEDLFYDNSIDHQLIIEADRGTYGTITIKNKSIYYESMQIIESLFSGNQIEIGSAEASEFIVQIADGFPSLHNQEIKVSMILGDNTDTPFEIGTYKVYSDRKTANGIRREIKAYDAMYDIINFSADNLKTWWRSLGTKTFKQIRDSFFSLVGVEQETVSFSNDSISITIPSTPPSNLTSKEVLRYILEFAGCYNGHIRRGKFAYIGLKASVNNKIRIEKANVISCNYDHYSINNISGIALKQSDKTSDTVLMSIGDGYIRKGSDTNPYYIEDNVFFKNIASEIQANTVVENMYSAWISGASSFTAAEAETRANLCIELGDLITVGTREGYVKTVVVQKTISGIQFLKARYTTDLDMYISNSNNGYKSEIMSLKENNSSSSSSSSESGSSISSTYPVIKYGIQEKIIQTSGTPEAITIKYGYTFKETPVVTISIMSNVSLGSIKCQIVSIGTTSFTVKIDGGDWEFATIQWIAVGQ